MDNPVPYSGNAGAYASVAPLNFAALSSFWFRVTQQPMPENPGQEGGLHCTVVYSKAPLQVSPAIAAETVKKGAAAIYEADVVDFEWWAGHDGDGYLVALLESPQLTARAAMWKTMGAIPTFEPYQPHVTMAKGPHALDSLANLSLLKSAIKAAGKLRILFNNETIEDLSQ